MYLVLYSINSQWSDLCLIPIGRKHLGCRCVLENKKRWWKLLEVKTFKMSLRQRIKSQTKHGCKVRKYWTTDRATNRTMENRKLIQQKGYNEGLLIIFSFLSRCQSLLVTKGIHVLFVGLPLFSFWINLLIYEFLKIIFMNPSVLKCSITS